MDRRSSNEEQRTLERFRPRYARAGSTADRAVERAAIGANVGANGYTTIAQAGELARRLGLQGGMRLLDIGCGRGYPGLYLARLTGCDVVGSDLPVASLRSAAQRATRQRLTRRATFVAASAVHLPFRPQSFDAVIHTDVLCCLRAKLSVLRACRRLLKPGGRMAFTTIYIAPGVSQRDYRRASRARGPGSAEKRAMTELFEEAGIRSGAREGRDGGVRPDDASLSRDQRATQHGVAVRVGRRQVRRVATRSARDAHADSRRRPPARGVHWPTTRLT